MPSNVSQVSWPSAPVDATAEKPRIYEIEAVGIEGERTVYVVELTDYQSNNFFSPSTVSHTWVEEEGMLLVFTVGATYLRDKILRQVVRLHVWRNVNSDDLAHVLASSIAALLEVLQCSLDMSRQLQHPRRQRRNRNPGHCGPSVRVERSACHQRQG